MKVIIPNSRVMALILAWLNNNFGDLQTITSTNFPNSVIYYHNNKAIVYHDRVSRLAYVSYDDIWWFLTSMFDLEPNMVAKILKKWLFDKYKIDVDGVFEISSPDLFEDEAIIVAESATSEVLSIPDNIKTVALRWLDHTYAGLKQKYSLQDENRIYYIDSDNKVIIEYSSKSGCAWVEEYMYSFLMTMFSLGMVDVEVILGMWLKTTLGLDNLDYGCIDIDPSQDVLLI